MIILQAKDKVTKEWAENTYHIKIPANRYSSYWKVPIGRENPVDDEIISKEFVVLYLGNYHSIYGRKTQHKKKKQ
jgi:hypothetical protein